jgi:hypothetical protein
MVRYGVHRRVFRRVVAYGGWAVVKLGINKGLLASYEFVSKMKILLLSKVMITHPSLKFNSHCSSK